ncbi:phosphoribosylglycinamide formyltransferase [Lentibacillus sediminis]|uniref:phosphoribosylglycinamide formyltransferase n=1 Tax=Lentibacillus sediminis TaxID=1940529 RepID=UPI000C1BF4EF|nr:phosphoribosylglycinamide formyltransferase [Lentibacillus sediminis]
MTHKVKAAVFASGSGSNFQAIMEADTACEIVLLVCDKAGAAVVEKAATHQVPVLTFNPKDYSSKAEYEQMLQQKLTEAGVEWIFLAGYMRLIGPVLLQTFPERIINIHPSLLPAFPGKDAIGQALAAGARQTGVTVHYIDEGIDTGPVIAQATLDVSPADNEATLKQKIQRLEHQLYPQVINQLILEK